MRTPNPLVLLIILLSFSAPALGQSGASFSIGRVMIAPFPTELAAAPTGSKVAWVYNKEGGRNIWVSEGPSFQGKPITGYTADDGQDITNLSFTPDGKQIVYVRGGGPNRQREILNPTNHPDGAKREVWTISAAGGTPRRLAEGSDPVISPDGKQLAFLQRGQIWTTGWETDATPAPLFQIRGSAGSLTWSPDVYQPKLAFVSNRGDHAFVGVYDFSTDRITYFQPSVDRDNSPVWSPDGTRIAFMRMPGERQDLIFFSKRSGLPWSILVAEVASGKTQTIWTATEGPGSAFRFISAANQLFWGDGDQIVFPWEGDGWTHLYAVSAKGGTARCLTPGKFEVQYVSMSPDGKSMLYSSNQDDIDRQHVWKVPLPGGSPQPLTLGKGIGWAPVMTTDFTLWKDKSHH